MITQDNITVGQRIGSPTPKFFKTLRTISLVLAAIGGAIASAPVAPVLAAIGGYVLAAGSVAGAVSSLPVDFNKLDQQQKEQP